MASYCVVSSTTDCWKDLRHECLFLCDTRLGLSDGWGMVECGAVGDEIDQEVYIII